MVVDLSPGDVVRVVGAVTLTVLAVEDGLIRFGLETPEGESPVEGVGCEEPGLEPTQNWWELN